MIEVYAMSRKYASVSSAGQTAVHGDPDKTSPCAADCGPWEHEIRQRAYDISLASRGAAPDPRADWLQAETELLGRRFLGLT